MIALLRSVLFLFLAILITAPAGLLVTLSIALPIKARFRIVAAWRTVFLAICEHVLGIRYQIVGRENIPAVPVVVLAKHQSAWETVALQEFFPPLVFVLKCSLMLIPFLGWGFFAMRMISIDRTAGRQALMQVIKQGRDRLKNGFSVAIFPEGTRVAPGETRRFKTGGALLAGKAGVPAVPVAHNAGEFWPKNAFVKKPGLITVSIGPAIDPADKTAEEITLIAEQWIEDEMRRISPHRYADTGHVVKG